MSRKLKPAAPLWATLCFLGLLCLAFVLFVLGWVLR